MKIKLLDPKCLPRYEHEDDAAMDCRASKDVSWINENNIQVAYVPLGFKVEVPRGYVLMLFIRNEYGFDYNISLANGTELVDTNFREEMIVKLIRVGISTDNPDMIEQYDKVVQCILIERPKVYWNIVDELSEIKRGTGFSSSGIK